MAQDFYRLNSVTATQPRASKHWRNSKHWKSPAGFIFSRNWLLGEVHVELPLRWMCDASVLFLTLILWLELPCSLHWLWDKVLFRC